MSGPPRPGLGDGGDLSGRITAADRLLVVAPHPDDESLAAGGILQRAADAGAPVRILFLTDGENNPWAQRATELRLSIGPAQRQGFGRLRRGEVAAALASLGVDPGAARFLGFPDQGLTGLLVEAADRLVGPLRDELQDFRPTVLVHPSLADLHPDHSAAAVALDLAVRRACSPPLLRLPYVVHHAVAAGVAAGAAALVLTPAEVERKRAAILAHRTQHRLRGPWLLSFAGTNEGFLDSDLAAAAAGHPIRGARATDRSVDLEIASRSHPRAFGSRTVLVVLEDRQGGALGVRLPLPRRDGEVVPGPGAASQRFAGTRWQGRAGRGRLTLAPAAIAGAAVVYAKVSRRFGFFDEAGWRILP